MSFAMIPLEIELPKTTDPTLPPYSPISRLSRRAPTNVDNLDSIQTRETIARQQDLEATQEAPKHWTDKSWVNYAVGFDMWLILLAFVLLAIVRRDFYREHPSSIETDFVASIISFAFTCLFSIPLVTLDLIVCKNGLRWYLVALYPVFVFVLAGFVVRRWFSE